ncbi:MAG: hypothetical protein HY288_03375, partial [Planctomycetia bacterium]|nr:hypothetical protein [Planctomycetia bacterium]
VWADGLLKKEWLEVVLAANGDTGLAAADIFFFGNAVGESANSPDDAVVNSADVTAAQVHTGTADVHNPYDFNRDGIVDSQDVHIAQTNVNTRRTSLKLISVVQPAATARVAPLAGADPPTMPFALAVPSQQITDALQRLFPPPGTPLWPMTVARTTARLNAQAVAAAFGTSSSPKRNDAHSDSVDDLVSDDDWLVWRGV